MPIITAMKHVYFQQPFHHRYFEVQIMILKYVSGFVWIITPE